jgi:nicotinamide mononucleotide transporter
LKELKAHSLEIAAVLSSLCYTVLISYGIIWCWLFALLASGIFMYICFRRKIFAEVALQIFYMAMAVYGYLNWGNGLNDSPESLSLTIHFYIISSSLVLIALSGFALRKYSESALPFLDSFTTISSIAATILMIQLYPENWLYWILIDAVSIFLYYKRGLKISAALYALYTLLALNGYLVWSAL